MTRWQSNYPPAMVNFLDDIEAGETSLRCLPKHRTYLRAANLADGGALD